MQVANQGEHQALGHGVHAMYQESAASHLRCLAILQGSPSELSSPTSPERPLGLRTFVRSFSAGNRGYEKMHHVKQNMKQLLMPWKRKISENDEEEVQSNDDFGTHPVLQVSIEYMSVILCCTMTQESVVNMCLRVVAMVLHTCCVPFCCLPLHTNVRCRPWHTLSVMATTATVVYGCRYCRARRGQCRDSKL